MVIDPIDGDPKQPAAKFVRLADSGNASIGPHEYILCKVFGIHSALYAIVNQAVYISLIAINQSFKGRAVSVSGLHDDVGHLFVRGFRAGNIMR